MSTTQQKGRVKDVILYRNQPLNVDVDPGHLEKLNAPIDLTITKDSIFYIVSGTYYVPTNDNSNEGPYSINRKITNLPATIATRAGIITISSNYGHTLKNSDVLNVSILSPRMAANKYTSELQVSQTAKSTSIAQLQLTDEVPQRSLDYLKQLAIVYNRQANEDKNTNCTSHR